MTNLGYSYLHYFVMEYTIVLVMKTKILVTFSDSEDKYILQISISSSSNSGN
jgi:hypothetical protein